MASTECGSNALPQSLEKLNLLSDYSGTTPSAPPSATIVHNPFDLSNIAAAPNIEEQLFGPVCHHKSEDNNNNRTHKKEQNLHQIRTNKQKPNKNNLRKLFRDPILHYLNGNYSVYAAKQDDTTNGNFPLADTDAENSNKNRIDFKTLVNDCANLTLSSAIDCKSDSFRIMQHRSTVKRNQRRPGDPFQLRSPNTSTPMLPLSASSSSSFVDAENNNNNATTSCSQQALLTYSPCDVTCDELASYFETFVHIPKKMSTMADAMYI